MPLATLPAILSTTPITPATVFFTKLAVPNVIYNPPSNGPFTNPFPVFCFIFLKPSTKFVNNPIGFPMMSILSAILKQMGFAWSK